MKYTIFYSWHSQLNQDHQRYLIRDALKNVTKSIAKEWEVSGESEIEKREVAVSPGGTAGVPGAADIADTIFEKIRQSDIFIADLTIVNSASKDERPTSNANVLVELGYASAVLGWKRIIVIVNTAYGLPETLPFDVRKRGAITYDLAPDKDGEKADARKNLEGVLKGALLDIY